jgi:hypothetical protein
MFAAGQWGKSLSLIEERRDAYVQQVEETDRLGVVQRRLARSSRSSLVPA